MPYIVNATVKDNNIRGKVEAKKILDLEKWPKECKEPSDIHDYLELDEKGNKWQTLK